AEERENERFGMQPIELALDPPRDAGGGLERHLGRGLVVIVVVALETVVAREVALQRRQDGHAQLGGVAANVGKELIERPPIRVAVVDEEALIRQERQRLARFGVEIVYATACGAVEERPDIRP